MPLVKNAYLNVRFEVFILCTVTTCCIARNFRHFRATYYSCL